MKSNMNSNERLFELFLCPMVGHKRTISPIYQDYHFLPLGETRPQQSLGFVVELPALQDEVFSISLKVTGAEHARVTTNIKDVPFLLNGCVVYEADIKFGDQLTIGHNVIRFKRKVEAMAGKHNEWHEWENMLPAFLHSSLNLLIEGETGTGKTRLAKWIYDQHPQFKKWCHVNLASYAPSLIESELFGHVKGAFTGAHCDKKGALEDAHQGLLFLDEIDSLPMEMQVKLLLFLDDQTFRPVGSNITKSVKTKIIFASGRSLFSLLEQGQIRKDFYYRLSSGLHLQLPSLRLRPALIEDYLNAFCETHYLQCHPTLRTFYLHYDWPGNYRQLKDHFLKKRVNCKNGKLEFDLLDQALTHRPLVMHACQEMKDTFNTLPTLEELKLLYGQSIYQLTGGNWDKAAGILGVSTKTVKSMIWQKSA